MTVVYQGKCSHCMRIGVAVPLSGAVSRLRQAVAQETKIPVQQVLPSLKLLCLKPNAQKHAENPKKKSHSLILHFLWGKKKNNSQRLKTLNKNLVLNSRLKKKRFIICYPSIFTDVDAEQGRVKCFNSEKYFYFIIIAYWVLVVL